MKFKTMRMTRTCTLCGLSIYYRSEDKMREADSVKEYYHGICKPKKK